MDKVKTMDLSFMNKKRNNAVVFANIQTSALKKKKSRKWHVNSKQKIRQVYGYHLVLYLIYSDYHFITLDFETIL